MVTPKLKPGDYVVLAPRDCMFIAGPGTIRLWNDYEDHVLRVVSKGIWLEDVYIYDVQCGNETWNFFESELIKIDSSTLEQYDMD